MKTIGVIPARYESSRLKAKVLSDIHGKPMIQHVWERAQKSRLLDDLLIACDRDIILRAAEHFGAKVILSQFPHFSGSDRIAEAVSNLEVDYVVNIQADEPLISPVVIDGLVELMKNPDCVMATAIKILDDKTELENPNVVKVVLDQNQNAIYFSRSCVPYNHHPVCVRPPTYYKHLGIYAYRKDFLLTFVRLRRGVLEEAEALEQLRALEAGYKIKTLLTDVHTISVDTLEDLQRVQEYLKDAVCD